MNASKVMRALAVLGCLAMVMPGAAMSASFGEVAGGVKTLTEAGKDVNDIKQSNSGQSAPQKQKPAMQKKAEKKQPAAKKQSPRRAAPQNDRVRGG